MPTILPRYDVKDKAINQKGDTELRDRIKVINRAWDYYYGQHDPSLINSPGGIDYNVTINISAQSVDKTVSFFIPDTPRIELQGGVDNVRIGETFTEVRTPQQEQLDTFWNTNEIDSFVLDVSLSGIVTGHNFIRLIPSMIVDNNTPEVGLIDPRNIIAYWDITKSNRLLFYRLVWQLDSSGQQRRIQDIVPRWLIDHDINLPVQEDLSLGWMIFEYERDVNSELKLISVDRWMHPFPPIVDWKNSQAPFRYYGQSDLKHVHLNDALNFVASNTNKIIYHHAGPQTVVTGGTLPDDAHSGPDQIIEIPGEDAKMFNLEMQSDLDASMQLMDILRASFFAQSRVVDLATVRDKLARVTNFGVRMIYSDMLDMIANKRLFYGDGIAEISRRALILMGNDEEDIPEIFVKFVDPLPTDRLEKIQSLQIEQATGLLSRQTVADEMGRDAITELSNLEEEKKLENENQLPPDNLPPAA